MKKTVLMGFGFMVVSAAFAAQAERLTYIGADNGDWLAVGVWQNESGTAVDWSDGATAVLGNTNIKLSSDVTAAGLEWSTTAKRTLSGAGKLTLGAGGIVNGGSGELNIQNSGGLHLSENQTWNTITTSSSPLICLDGLHAVTTAEGVTLTVTGKTCLRWNAKASLPASTTVHVIVPAYISFSSGTAAFGNPTMILEGNGSRVNFGSRDDHKNCVAGMLASTLHLRNGADVSFSNGYPTTFGIPRIVVDGTQSADNPSEVYGSGRPSLTQSMEIDVAEGCRFRLAAIGQEQSGATVGFVKTGSGVLALASDGADFSGDVDVQAGYLEISAGTASGTGLLTAAAGTTVTLPASGTLANGFSGAGTFEKKAAGELTLTGAAAELSGRVVVSAGTVRAAFAAVAGGKVLTEAASAWAVLEDVAYEAVAPYLETGAAGTILAGAGKRLTISALAADAVPALDAEKDGLLRIAALTGAGWTKAAAGDVRIDSLEGYTGTTITVSGGVLQLASASVIPDGCVVETVGAGIVQFDTTDGYNAAKVGGTKSVAFADGGSTTVDTSAAGGVPATLAVAEGRTLNVTALTGSGDFYKTGAGTINLSGAENFAGRIIVQDGTLILTGSAGENTVIVEKGVFSATGSGTVLRNAFDVRDGVLQAMDGASLGAGQVTLAAAGTICAMNGGTFGWSELPIGPGTVRILSGGVVATTTLKTQANGKLVISDGTGVTAPLALAGGTLSFDAETTLDCEITQTAATIITVPDGKTVTLTGKYTNQGGKCRPSGPGRLVFAGGGDFLTGTSELFVQGGEVEISKKDFLFKAYFGVEEGGRKLIVRDGATVTGKGSSVGLHVGTRSGQESVVEVGADGMIDLQEGYHVRFGVGKATIGRLRITEGGVFRHATSGEFTFAYGEASTGSVEVVKGMLETGKQLKKGGSGAQATAVFDTATVKVGADCTLIGGGLAGELRGANALDVGARTVTLGEGWTGTGSLAVTGADGVFRLATSVPDWTGGFSVTGADLALGADVALANELTTVTDGAVAVADGTASIPLLGGASVTKTGAGTLVVSAVEDPAFDLTVEAGGVQVAPSAALKPAGVPAFWLDAAAGDSFRKDGNVISEWWDCRQGVNRHAAKLSGHNAPLYDATGFNGKPFVDFGVMSDYGRVGGNRMMQFSAQQDNIRTVFWMIGSRNGGGFLLGDKNASGSARCFHRAPGAKTTYGAVASDPLWGTSVDRGGYVKDGTTWLNGAEIDGTKTGLGGAWDLVAWRLSETHDAANQTPCAVWLASCYAATESNGRLNGGQDLAEIIIYTNRLTDAEVRATQRYLVGKWMPTNAANRVSLGTLTMRGANTSFTVDDGVPVFVSSVVVEGRDVTVNGVATDVANDVVLGEVSVAAGGEWNAANFLETTVTNLTFAANAVVGATVNAEGRAASLALQGVLTLPETLLYNVSVPEKVTVRRTEILKAETLTGAPSWSRAEGGSTAASVFADAAFKALFLQGHSGTLLYIR